ncbi:transcription antitermination factor NusB [Bacillus pseudomycoides]|uniref:N utilization substance protein NusB n=1 Tax=Bacillus pseudomycoides TaxID=64104 RepID=UPI000BEDCF1A|nr:N utilization substance protein NusB [Bacillus pseudomycoides]MED4653642.1 N utilization substance protein NusB [Bacillus pseudomycoides]PDY00897.1 transcription antitermination factor NusB [Bacillus pseudomycoides]PEE05495.1 transcription antitermination factor NusB [Bacillus pseudomycoides]PEK81417.1 transcription antitermination factor NusB [Bacillus pseudomycoides]PEM80025.1 transcription antitermination factor NusB [Bacillus pseudomycoides]
MKRRTARERAMQALYQMDITGELEPKVAVENTLEEGEETNEFLELLVVGCVEHKEAIDEAIRQNLKKWKLERISIVDRSILRLAVYEMKYMEEIPHNVTINEAIEIAKTFGDEESRRFINGVLSNIKDTL